MDLLNVHTALRYACSQDPNELKVGEQQLKAWQKDKGYYAGLAVRFKSPISLSPPSFCIPSPFSCLFPSPFSCLFPSALTLCIDFRFLSISPRLCLAIIVLILLYDGWQLHA